MVCVTPLWAENGMLDVRSNKHTNISCEPNCRCTMTSFDGAHDDARLFVPGFPPNWDHAMAGRSRMDIPALVEVEESVCIIYA